MYCRSILNNRKIIDDAFYWRLCRPAITEFTNEIPLCPDKRHLFSLIDWIELNYCNSNIKIAGACELPKNRSSQ